MIQITNNDSSNHKENITSARRVRIDLSNKKLSHLYQNSHRKNGVLAKQRHFSPRPVTIPK